MKKPNPDERVRNTPKTKQQAPRLTKEEAAEIRDALIKNLRLGYIQVRGGVFIPLDYDVQAMGALQESIGYQNTWDDLLKDESTKWPTIITLITGMANCAMRRRGEKEEFITEDWVRENLIPGEYHTYKMSIDYTVSHGWETESPLPKPDVTLERIKKAGATRV